MKKIILFTILIISFCFLFTGCSKNKDKFQFEKAELNNGVYCVTVSNDTEEFSFLNEISVCNDYMWSVSKDEYGLNNYVTKKVPLNIGNNNFYIILLDKNNNSTIYEVCIRRRPLYTVTFDTCGGTIINSQLVEEGFSPTAPDNPVKYGFEFDYWDKPITDKIYRDTTYHASWLVNTYTLQFDKGSGYGEMVDQVVLRNTDISINENTFKKNGYSFCGWEYNNNILQDKEVINNLTVDRGATITLTAIFIPNTYDLTLNPDGGLLVGSITNKYEVTTDVDFTLPIATKENFIFGGWYINFEQITYDNGLSCKKFNLANNVTLVAKWFKPISTIEQFQDIHKDLDANYRLMNDLDFTGVEINKHTSGSWGLLGDYSGIFDGNNKSLKNISTTTSLFSTNNGVIKNCNLINFTISNSKCAGVIAFINNGTIKECSVSGKVSEYCDSTHGWGASKIGGIVNSNYGYVGFCNTDINFSCYNYNYGVYIGGIVGSNNTTGKVEYCYSVGQIIAECNRDKVWIGGVVGINDGLLENCFATNSLTATCQYNNYIEIGKITGRGKTINCYEDNRVISSNSPYRFMTCSALNDYSQLLVWVSENWKDTMWILFENNLPTLFV